MGPAESRQDPPAYDGWLNRCRGGRQSYEMGEESQSTTNCSRKRDTRGASAYCKWPFSSHNVSLFHRLFLLRSYAFASKDQFPMNPLGPNNFEDGYGRLTKSRLSSLCIVPAFNALASVLKPEITATTSQMCSKQSWANLTLKVAQHPRLSVITPNGDRSNLQTIGIKEGRLAPGMTLDFWRSTRYPRFRKMVESKSFKLEIFSAKEHLYVRKQSGGLRRGQAKPKRSRYLPAVKQTRFFSDLKILERPEILSNAKLGEEFQDRATTFHIQPTGVNLQSYQMALSRYPLLSKLSPLIQSHPQVCVKEAKPTETAELSAKGAHKDSENRTTSDNLQPISPPQPRGLFGIPDVVRERKFANKIISRYGSCNEVSLTVCGTLHVLRRTDYYGTFGIPPRHSSDVKNCAVVRNVVLMHLTAVVLRTGFWIAMIAKDNIRNLKQLSLVIPEVRKSFYFMGETSRRDGVLNLIDAVNSLNTNSKGETGSPNGRQFTPLHLRSCKIVQWARKGLLTQPHRLHLAMQPFLAAAWRTLGIEKTATAINVSERRPVRVTTGDDGSARRREGQHLKPRCHVMFILRYSRARITGTATGQLNERSRKELISDEDKDTTLKEGEKKSTKPKGSSSSPRKKASPAMRSMRIFPIVPHRPRFNFVRITNECMRIYPSNRLVMTMLGLLRTRAMGGWNPIKEPTLLDNWSMLDVRARFSARYCDFDFLSNVAIAMVAEPSPSGYVPPVSFVVSQCGRGIGPHFTDALDGHSSCSLTGISQDPLIDTF
ncbi:hypothetical protein SCHPADRAFT_923541, partial [Schizopora paradoxa]